MQQEREGTRVPAIKGVRTRSTSDQQLVPGSPRDAELWPLLNSNEMIREYLLRHGGLKRRAV